MSFFSKGLSQGVRLIDLKSVGLKANKKNQCIIRKVQTPAGQMVFRGKSGNRPQPVNFLMRTLYHIFFQFSCLILNSHFKDVWIMI